MLKPALALILSLLVLPAFAEASCPVINGSYVMDGEKDGKPTRFTLKMFTRIERGVFSYSVPSGFQVADGKPHPLKHGNAEGVLSYSCGHGSLIQETQEYGSDFVLRKKITPLSKMELRVEYNVPGRDGIYTKIL
jgi:hypothetical protein